MLSQDPLVRIEALVRDLQHESGKYTQSARKRYPLVFAFLLAFSIAAILHGFELWTDSVPLLRENPWILIGGGSLLLLCTGKLYKALNKL